MSFLVLLRWSKSCSQRRTLQAYTKSCFNQLYPTFVQGLQSNSLAMALSLGSLATDLGKKDQELFIKLKKVLKANPNRLNNQRCMKLLKLLNQFQFFGDELPILEDFKAYFQKNRGSFSTEQKKYMQALMAGKQNEILAFPGFRINFHGGRSSKQTVSQSNVFKLNRNGKKATLFGITHGDYGQLSLLRKELRKGNTTVVLELPPLFQHQVRPLAAKSSIYQGLILPSEQKNKVLEEDSFPLKKLQGPQIQFYVKEYLEYRKAFFQIRKGEELVYHWDRQWVLHQCATLIYSEYLRPAGNRFILADLSLQQEICEEVSLLTLEQAKRIYAHQIDCLRQSTKEGCEKCGGSRIDLFSPIVYADQSLYSFRARQQNLARAIRQAMDDSQQNQRVLAVFGADHATSIAALVDKPAPQSQRSQPDDAQFQTKFALLSSLFDDELDLNWDKEKAGRVKDLRSEFRKLLKLTQPQGRTAECHAFSRWQ